MNKPILFLLASTLVLTVCAQPPEDRKTRGCSDPPGYSDTPVIPGQTWRVHDITRPHPPKVPGAVVTTPPPADAAVLFNGKDLSQWKSYIRGRESAPQWKVANGYVEVAGRGDLVTKQQFGDIQLHLEWQVPTPVEGCGQWAANSGVILMGRYEIQVLESFNSVTYADGQASAMYGQFPPRVNASLPPGQWQSYDILFEAPRWEGSKMLKAPAVTVFHNGVMVHHRQEFVGQMAHRIHKPFEVHGPEAPLVLQNHDATVRYRNIWIRPLKGYDAK